MTDSDREQTLSKFASELNRSTPARPAKAGAAELGRQEIEFLAEGLAFGPRALRAATAEVTQRYNLGPRAKLANRDLPTLLGGVCVTLNNRPMHLMATSPTQITAQVPPELAAGRYPLVVRNLERKTSTVAPINVTLTKYAPAVLVDQIGRAHV